MDYSKINEFCKIRNSGGAHKNGTTGMPNRFKWLVELCESEGMDYEIDTYQHPRFPDNNFYNLILKGTSNKMFIAHHDIVNPNVDNANDNSASVINCLMIKKQHPEVHVAIIDGEEPPMLGVGSNRLGQQIQNGDFGDIEWVLNLELTGKGGKTFFVGNYPGPLTSKLVDTFGAPIVNTPFNDSVILRKYGIDSTVVTTLPLNEKGELRMEYLFYCHTSHDMLNIIDPNDMKEFVEEVVYKLI